MSDNVELHVEDTNQAQVEPNANTMISLQLSIAEVAGLRALIKENEQRRTNDINNRIISEINNNTNIPNTTRKSEHLSPILNNNTNIMYTTSENRPTRLFTEEYNNKNGLNTSNNTINTKRSNINIQKLTDINLKRKPPSLIAGSTAIQYLDWADSMEKFLRICGNLDEYLYEDKIHEFMSSDEEYETIQTIQYIQCKLDESIQDNNEARSLVSLINEENIQKWWKTVQYLYFPLHEASRNRRCEEFEDLKQLPGELTSLFTTRIIKHARMLRKQGEEISDGKLTKIFCKGISPAFKERLENYSLSLDAVNFEKLRMFGEKLDAIRMSSPAKLPNFISAKANLETSEQI